MILSDGKEVYEAALSANKQDRLADYYILHEDHYEAGRQISHLTCFKNGSFIIHYGMKLAGIFKMTDSKESHSTMKLVYELKAEPNNIFWYRNRLFAVFQERIYGFTAVLSTSQLTYIVSTSKNTSPMFVYKSKDGSI